VKSDTVWALKKKRIRNCARARMLSSPLKKKQHLGANKKKKNKKGTKKEEQKKPTQRKKNKSPKKKKHKKKDKTLRNKKRTAADKAPFHALSSPRKKRGQKNLFFIRKGVYQEGNGPFDQKRKILTYDEEYELLI